MDAGTLTVLIVASVATTAVAGSVKLGGWRQVAKEEAELYESVKMLAKTDDEKEMVERLRKSSLERARKGLDRKPFTIEILSGVLIGVPYTLVAAAISLMVVIARSMTGVPIPAGSLFALLGLSAVADSAFAVWRSLTKRSSERKHGNSDSSEQSSAEEIHEREKDEERG